MQFISNHSAIGISTSLQLRVKPKVLSITCKVLHELALCPPALHHLSDIASFHAPTILIYVLYLNMQAPFHSGLLIYCLLSLEWPSNDYLYGLLPHIIPISAYI